MRQSEANPSPAKDSLLSRESAGKFANFKQFRQMLPGESLLIRGVFWANSLLGGSREFFERSREFYSLFAAAAGNLQVGS